MAGSPAIFMDKDGVIVDNSRYPQVVPKADLLPQAIDGLRLLAQSDFKTVVISNQSWIAKGHMTKKEVDDVFQDLSGRVARFGLTFTSLYYCPHARHDDCECRKPRPGLIHQAAREHGIDLSRSFFIGDMTCDIAAGKAAGLTTILVKTGVGGRDGEHEVAPDFVAEDFSHAVRWIIQRERTV